MKRGQRMVRIDVSFLVLAMLLLIVGLCLGIGMGIAHDFQLAPVHAHVNLVGFVALAIFGLTYKAYPVLAASRLALVHLGLSAVGALVLPFGIFLAAKGGSPGIAIAGSFAVLGGALLFFANLVRLLVVGENAGTRLNARALA